MTETADEASNKWVITAIDRVSVERALGRVVDVVKEQGLELDYIRALSHVMPNGRIETPEGEPGYSCAEIWLYGRQFENGRDREAAMRAEFDKLGDEIGADIEFRRESEYRAHWQRHNRRQASPAAPPQKKQIPPKRSPSSLPEPSAS